MVKFVLDIVLGLRPAILLQVISTSYIFIEILKK